MLVRRFPALVLSLLLSLSMCVCLIGCSRKNNTTALCLLLAAADVHPAIPAGDIYLLSDSASLHQLNSVDTPGKTIRVADSTLLSDAFASGRDASLPAALDGVVDDGAMRFATAASPCEYIVFHCISRVGTDAIAALLHDRLDILRRQYRGSDDEAMLARAEVVILGKYVLLVIAPDPDAAINAARRVLS